MSDDYDDFDYSDEDYSPNEYDQRDSRKHLRDKRRAIEERQEQRRLMRELGDSWD